MTSEITTCRLGCGAELEAMARFAPYRVCPQCGSGFFAPPPKAAYWTPGHAPSAAQQERWTERARQWAPVVGAGPGRVLDVGCGFGHFVRWAALAGWDAWGYDPDDWSRSLSVAAEGRIVASLDDLSGPFDVITMWDVLEHVSEPVELARSVAELLTPDGRIVICSPNFDALRWRWWWLRREPNRFRVAVKPDEHIVQFTPAGLERALEQAGYREITRVHPPLSRTSVPGLNPLVRRLPWLRSGLFVAARAPNPAAASNAAGARSTVLAGPLS
jgi:SAM-dependent methyltransferase